MKKQRHSRMIVILGPTATGKSDLAVKIAKLIKPDGEVISADSRQVYRGLDIGTGKITKREMRGVRHHLLDVANPKDRFSVEDYRKLALDAVSNIRKRGHTPIICGGTGFYIQSITDGTAFPDVPPNEKLREALAKKSLEYLRKRLLKEDPRRAKELKATSDWKNPRRIIRALEIVSAIGKVPAMQKLPSRNTGLVMIGITSAPDELRKRIRKRLEKRIDGGMIEEAKRLHKKGLTWKRMEELGLEYRYMARYLQGKISKQEMTEKLAIEIGRYAKRQMTWFKRDKRIRWFKPGVSARRALSGNVGND